MDQIAEQVHAATQARCSERRLLAHYAVTRVLAESATLKGAAQEILRAIGESLGWELVCSGASMRKLRCSALLIYGIQQSTEGECH
jgi:hypothetical protein